jgi:hypothetical protein
MNDNIGLWIDHGKAVIIRKSDALEETIETVSCPDWQPGSVNGERSHEPFESPQIPTDDTQDRKFAHGVNTYYHQVIDCIHETRSLLVIGPGEAKGELIRRLEKWKPSNRSVTVETADKMTDRQIVAKVRDFFKGENPVIAL